MTRLPDCGSTECSLAAHVADQQDRGRRYPAGTLSACNQLVSPVFLVGGCAAVAARAQLHAVCNRGPSHQTAYTVHLHRSGLLRLNCHIGAFSVNRTTRSNFNGTACTNPIRYTTWGQVCTFPARTHAVRHTGASPQAFGCTAGAPLVRNNANCYAGFSTRISGSYSARTQ